VLRRITWWLVITVVVISLTGSGASLFGTNVGNLTGGVVHTVRGAQPITSSTINRS
jgi:hypothetical protein